MDQAFYRRQAERNQIRMTMDPTILERDFVRRVGPDGVPEYIHRNMTPALFYRSMQPSRAEKQRAKAMRRKAAGKPSYRQRQASARAAKRKRSAPVYVSMV
jgi:hypothetical protein